MREVISVLILVVGVALGFVSYFVLAAPLGMPSHEGFANPRVPYAATLFVIAVAFVFLSVLVYELFPEGERG
jgi:uncharacterized sodium:solute symporter family permease YidK